MTFQVPEDARLEVKFTTSDVYLDAVLSWLRFHPVGAVSPYPDRWVNNIYFETPGYASFDDHISGARGRAKVRYRWYGPLEAPAPGALEIKCKRNLFSWKLRYGVTEAPYFPGADWRAIRKRLEAQLPAVGKAWLDAHPLPVILNRYHRRYLCTADGGVRVTVDTRIAFWDQRFKTIPNFSHRTELPGVLVVELKFLRKDRRLASDLARSIPLRLSKHSKYLTGIITASHA